MPSQIIESAGQVPGFEYNSEPNGGNELGLSHSQANMGVSLPVASLSSQTP